MRQQFRNYRDYLYSYEHVFPYAVLGVVGGVGSAALVLVFDAAIGWMAMLWNVGERGENFEALPRWMHFALPAAGAAMLGLVFTFIRKEHRDTGVVHVLSRMDTHYGALPWQNALVQLLGGAFALATGQSGGREGPGVHLGAAANSLLGQALHLPNNSLRVLVACGAAGSISVAFNTPLAGVIFAMEVVVAEYTVMGFLPVIIAAVSAMLVGQALGRSDHLISVSGMEFSSLSEVPFVLLVGLCAGVLVALFTRVSRYSARLQARLGVGWRFCLAGIFTGLLALWVPEVLGVGTDSLRLIMLGEMGIATLAMLMFAKVLATGVTTGLGMPVGLIGPNMLIGACLGGLLGGWGISLMPQVTTDLTLYVIIGMAAAMAAVLNAPLAAILAVVELTDNVHVVMQAMVAIVAANLTNTELFKHASAHQIVLRQLRRRVPEDPLNQLLHRTHVTRTMDTNVRRLPVTLDPSAAESLRHHSAHWCLVQRNDDSLYLLHGSDLSNWLQENVVETELDLTDLPLRRWSITRIPVQASLRQAMDAMREHTAEAACVYGKGNDGHPALLGVVTRETIEKFTLSRL